MPVSADTLGLLIAAGLDGDDLLRVVASIEADNKPKPRSANAERQARFRANRRAQNVTNNVTSNATDNVTAVTTLARVEDITSNLEISEQEENKKDNAPKARVSDLAAFKAELQDLDNDHIEALIKHRRAKRAQITGLSARLFRKDAGTCGMSLVEAVDTCIGRNWITVKPEYFAARNQPRSGAPPPQQNPFGGFENFAKKRGWIGEPGSNDSPNEDAGKLSGHHQRQDAGSQVVPIRGGLAGRYQRGDL